MPEQRKNVAIRSRAQAEFAIALVGVVLEGCWPHGDVELKRMWAYMGNRFVVSYFLDSCWQTPLFEWCRTTVFRYMCALWYDCAGIAQVLVRFRYMCALLFHDVAILAQVLPRSSSGS